MSERRRGRESLSEGVMEAEGKECTSKAFRPNARWSAIMVKNGLRVEVDVSCDNHVEAFLIT